jgi:hypothetical protein
MLKKNVEILIDAIGQPYLGCSFSWHELQEFLTKFYTVEPDHEKYSSNRKVRDGEHYHMTFMNVCEYRRAELPIIKEPLSIELLGLGKATADTNVGESTAYFVVCKCQRGQELRKQYNLSEKDFHITVGFNPKDVFNVSKKEVII